MDKVSESKPSVINLTALSKQLQDRPDRRVVWPGIVEGTLNLVFGPPKSGKTTLCENLALCICNGEKSFLDKPIGIEQSKVLFISFEEAIELRGKRLQQISSRYLNAHEHFEVNSIDFMRSVVDENDLEQLKNTIKSSEAKVVIIDSLNYLYGDGKIEASRDSRKLASRLRSIPQECEVTLIVIHHTTKRPSDMVLEMKDMAGSRVLHQEIDGALGVNMTSNQTRYLKLFPGRYYPNDEDQVLVFGIGRNHQIEKVGWENEHELLKDSSSAQTPRMHTQVLKAIKEILEETDKTYTTTNEVLAMVDVPPSSLYRYLQKLEREGEIARAHNQILLPNKAKNMRK